MKKLFTVDDIMVCFIAAIGYGFGETIARHLGWPELACVGASFVTGLACEEITSKIAFSKLVQKSPRNRVITYIVLFLIFQIGEAAALKWMGTSMLEYLGDQFVYVVGFPILGFVVNLLIRTYRIRKIRTMYGDGSEGFVFDVDKDEIEEVNKQNQPVHDARDAHHAVRTRTGAYVGQEHLLSTFYLGIPYAKPPVGELRWKAPEPLPPSEAVFEAKNYGASAVQVEHKGSIIKHHRQSEDCLTLNIYASKRSTKSKRPVLVVFHHGDFSYGSSVDPLLQGDNFVSKHPDILVVSFNYRLGIFGFIDFSEIPGGEAYPDTLNLGILDQLAALEWIKDNIAAFGGDPDNITALGFESGACSILMLAISQRAKGLFQKAFIFNGNPMAVYDTPQASRTLAKCLLEETQTTTMDELLQLDTDTLKDAAQKLWQNMCAPTFDGTWMPADPYRACQEGAASGIEFILGIPSNESAVYRAFLGEQNYNRLLSSAVSDMQENADQYIVTVLQASIKRQMDESSALEFNSRLVEQWNALCLYRSAVKLTDGGNKVHVMYWDEKPLLENLGSGTVDAAAALLGNDEALELYGNVMNADLSETLQNLLEKFIDGATLQLYSNEIKGVEALDWEPFPKALIVADETFRCDAIGDRLLKGLLEYLLE